MPFSPCKHQIISSKVFGGATFISAITVISGREGSKGGFRKNLLKNCYKIPLENPFETIDLKDNQQKVCAPKTSQGHQFCLAGDRCWAMNH